MDISAATNPSGRAAYIKAQSNIAQAEKKADTYTPARTQDEVAISFEAQEILAKEGTEGSFPVDAVSEEQVNSIKTTTFTTFADEFSKITQGYADTIREHYAVEHEENLTYDNPSTHIWDKYKNPDSPDFQCH